MTYRLTLVAPRLTVRGRPRVFGEHLVALHSWRTLTEARAWVAAQRMNISQELAVDEPYFVAVASNEDGEHVAGFECAREWPHDINDHDRAHMRKWMRAMNQEEEG